MKSIALLSILLIGSPLTADKVAFRVNVTDIAFTTEYWTVQSGSIDGHIGAEPITAPEFGITSDFKLKPGDQIKCKVIQGTMSLRCEED